MIARARVPDSGSPDTSCRRRNHPDSARLTAYIAASSSSARASDSPLRLPELAQLADRDALLDHEILEGDFLAGGLRPLAVRQHQIPIDEVVVLRPRRCAVTDPQNLLEVVGEALIAGNDEKPRHAGQVIGTLSQLVCQSEGFEAHVLAVRDVFLDVGQGGQGGEQQAEEQGQGGEEEDEETAYGHVCSRGAMERDGASLLANSEPVQMESRDRCAIVGSIFLDRRPALPTAVKEPRGSPGEHRHGPALRRHHR